MKLSTDWKGLPEVRAQLARLGAAPRRALAATAEDVESYAESQAARHNRTGALVASLYLRRAGEGFEVGHDLQRARQALFVHWGTKPHRIAPKKKRVLRWASGGAGFVFARGVQHPGYRGDAWMVRAAARAPLMFDRHLQAMLAAKG